MSGYYRRRRYSSSPITQAADSLHRKLMKFGGNFMCTASTSKLLTVICPDINSAKKVRAEIVDAEGKFETFAVEFRVGFEVVTDQLKEK